MKTDETTPKILIICLTRRGGLLHFNDCLVRELQHLCDLRVISIAGAEHIAGYDLPPQNQIELLTGKGARGTFTGLFRPAIWKKITGVFNSFDPDIVHITAAQEWNPILGAYIRQIRRKPLIYTLHDVIHHEGVPFHFRVTEGIFRHQPDGFVVLTEKGKEILVSEGKKKEDILVVPHGVYDFFSSTLDTPLAPKKEILFFGRIEPYKGIDVLLKASKRVLRRHPDWTLHIAGGGNLQPYESFYRKETQIRITNRFLSDEEVAEVMQQSAIVALPYLSATQSGVIPTAFAFRKPVIATNVGGIPDMIRDYETGLLVPPNDVYALEQALEKLIENKTLRNILGMHGWKFAQESLGWRSIAKKHITFYRNRFGSGNLTDESR